MVNKKGRFSGHKHSEITKLKIGKSNVGKTRGEKHYKWKGGVSNPRYKEKLAGRKKPKICDLCKRKGKICFDHNHKTGKFRGWLCIYCNVVVGFIENHPKVLSGIIDYIKNR